MWVFIWYNCLHWQLITNNLLLTVQIWSPSVDHSQQTEKCSEFKGQRSSLSSWIVSGKWFWHQRWFVLSQEVLPFLLMSVDLHSTDKHKCRWQSRFGLVVWPVCYDWKGQRWWPPGSLAGAQWRAWWNTAGCKKHTWATSTLTLFTTFWLASCWLSFFNFIYKMSTLFFKLEEIQSLFIWFYI